MNNRSENLLEYGSAEATRRYTRYLFRYPAKFHPPVARALLEATQPGDCVLDCFSGSGTLLIEARKVATAAVLARPRIGHRQLRGMGLEAALADAQVRVR